MADIVPEYSERFEKLKRRANYIYDQAKLSGSSRTSIWDLEEDNEEYKKINDELFEIISKSYCVYCGDPITLHRKGKAFCQQLN